MDSTTKLQVIADVKRMEGEADDTYKFRVYNCIYEKLDEQKG